MDLFFYTEDIQFSHSQPDSCRAWLISELRIEKREPGAISYIFCSNAYLREINRKYLNHNYFTDVITFDYSDENIVSGDIFISIEQVRENAEEYSVTFDEELQRVMIHGMLHLMNYNDSTEEGRNAMRRREDESLLRWKGMINEK